MKGSPTWLIHLSGGLDSTYALWDWITTHPNDHILIHHVRLQHTAENRLTQEADAVIKIINYLKNVGFKNFDLHESSFDYGTLPRISIKDIQIVSLFTSIILKTPKWKGINNLILSWHKGEVYRDDIRRGFRVKKMLEALEVDRDINFHFPIEHLTRADMAFALPNELLQAVHSCRQPKPHKQICGECDTCIEYINEGLNPR